VNVRAAGEVDEEETDAVAPRDHRPSLITDARKMQPEISLRQEQV
jgi:hypothetical protein